MSQAPPPPPGVPATPGGSTPPANPIEAWKLVVLERYTKFDGRAGRPEFWWFVLANLVVSIVLNVLSRVSGIFFIALVLYSLAVLVPSIAVGIRRLHDTDKSGWFLLLYLIPCVGWIIMIVLWAAEGTRGPNQFGQAAD